MTNVWKKFVRCCWLKNQNSGKRSPCRHDGAPVKYDPRKIVGEIDEIRAGRWDDQIRAGIDQRPETTETEILRSTDAAVSSVHNIGNSES
jgi:hypothetical protein